jgi:hypothetical protein
MINVKEMNLTKKDLTYIIQKIEGENLRIVKEKGDFIGYIDKREDQFIFFECREGYFLKQEGFFVTLQSGYLGRLKEIHILRNPKLEEEINKYFTLKYLFRK